MGSKVYLREWLGSILDPWMLVCNKGKVCNTLSNSVGIQFLQDLSAEVSNF